MLVGYPYGEIDPQFHRSLIHLFAYDAHHGRRVIDGAHLMMETSNVAHGRNQIVSRFLETTCEWLWWIDTDMVFEPDTLDRLLAVANMRTHPIVGALCFARMRGDGQEIIPTLYTLTGDPPVPARITTLPEPGLHQVAMTGAGCLLVHRSVFETIRDAVRPNGKTFGESSFPWFEWSPWVNDQGNPDVMGEDLTFCLRAGALGFPVHVDTRVEVGHVKPFVVDVQMFEKEQAAIWARDRWIASIPNFVVMPVRGHEELTTNLVAALNKQGGYSGLLIYDNDASDEQAYPWKAEVFPAAGMTIHEMWNAGIRECLDRAPVCNIAILNNDLEIGPDFLSGLAKALRSDEKLCAVSPNYDGRTVDRLVQPVQGIAAGREDGTGGLAGFAFMVKGELFGSVLPGFDEQFEFWYGDNDFVLTVQQAGGWVGITDATSVVHIGGGSQTAGGDGTRLGTPELEAAAKRDRAKFLSKWGGTVENRARRRERRKARVPAAGARKR